MSLQTIARLCTFDRMLTALALVAIGLAAALSPMQNDTWWHLRTGADIWTTGRLPTIDLYSHTAYGAFWPNHEWLAEAIFYPMYAVGGLPLLSLFTAAIIVCAWALTWRLAEGPSIQRFLLIASVLVPASGHWEARPHVFSLLFLLIVVTLIHARRYVAVPLVFLVWANCHGGVVLGLVVAGAMLGAATLDDWRGWWRAAVTLSATAIAMTLTPLGVSFWSEIPRSMARIRQYPIDEWQPPSLTDVHVLPFFAIALALCAACAWRWRALLAPERRRSRMLCAAALAVLPLALTAIRNVGPFVMLAVPALSTLVPAGITARFARRRTERPLMNLGILAAAGSVAALAIVCSYVWRVDRLQWSPLPEASLQALDRCPDNLYNRYDEGGYLIWFARNHRVFLDGRQDPYPVSLVHEQMRTEQSGDYVSTFSRYHIRCAYLPTASPVAARLATIGWMTLYRDRNWIVLTAASKPRT